MIQYHAKCHVSSSEPSVVIQMIQYIPASIAAQPAIIARPAPRNVPRIEIAPSVSGTRQKNASGDSSISTGPNFCGKQKK